MLKWFVIAALFLFPGTALPEIVKTAIPSGQGLQLYWWPKLAVVPGWHSDQDASLHYAFNAVVPDGHTFSDAESVIYAKANYKPRTPETKSVDDLVKQDIHFFKADDPTVTITKQGDLTDRDGMHFMTYEFAPQGKGNWETVSYGEEGDFFLIFTLSSQSEMGMQNSFPVFENIIANYAKGPNN